MLRGAFSQPLTFPCPEVPAVASLEAAVEDEAANEAEPAVTSELLSTRSTEVSEDVLELSEDDDEIRRILGMHSCKVECKHESESN